MMARLRITLAAVCGIGESTLLLLPSAALADDTPLAETAASVTYAVDTRTSPRAVKTAAELMARQGWTVARAEEYVEQTIRRGQVTPPARRPTYVIKDVRLFLNSVDRGVHLMQQAGVGAAWDRRDTDTDILVTIRIPKTGRR